MVRPKHCVHKYFTSHVNEGHIVKVKCNYCKWINRQNTTRMILHIKDGCKKCPVEIKRKVTTEACALETLDSDCECTEGTEATNDDNVENQLETRERIPDPRILQCQNPKSRSENAKKREVNDTIDKYICWQIPEAIQLELQTLLARAIFCSCSPLSLVENEHWIRFFAKLRPTFKLPSRYVLSNRLLDAEYLKVKEDVDKRILDAPCLGLQMDGWSNIHREAIVNVVMTTPEPIFIETIPTGADGHTGRNIADMIIDIIIKVGPLKIIGIVTDNAANMRLAWKLVQQEYPHITAYGCLLHGLHLFFKDICSEIICIVEVKKSCVFVVNEVRQSQILRAIFVEKQQSTNNTQKATGCCDKKSTLHTQGKTRFGLIFICMRSVSCNRVPLRELCVDPRAEKILSAETKQILLDCNFWYHLEETINLLKPLVYWLHKVESDESQMSLACSAFVEIENHFLDSISKSTLLRERHSDIMHILKNRYEFCIKPVHYAANLLDPAKRGEDLTDDELIEAQEFLIKMATHYSDIEGIAISDVLTECNMFRLQEGVWNKTHLKVTATSMTPYLWWKACCVGKSLRSIALKILSLPPTSAACERTNSTYAGVHNKTTNRLLIERAGKITYIKQNTMYLNTTQKQKSHNIPPELKEHREDNVFCGLNVPVDESDNMQVELGENEEPVAEYFEEEYLDEEFLNENRQE